MSIKTIHKDVRKVDLSTLFHRISAERYINESSDIGIVFFSADPDWGGNMYNPLIDVLFKKCVESKISTLRLSYRKTSDTSKKINLEQYIIQSNVSIDYFIEATEQQVKHLFIIGTYMGAYIAKNIKLRRPDITGIIMINPSFLHYNFADIVNESPYEYIIVGNKNPNILNEPLRSYCLKSNLDPSQHVEYIEDSDQYFHGKEEIVADISMKIINNLIQEISTKETIEEEIKLEEQTKLDQTSPHIE